MLDLEWRRARRARSVFSLLFVDVDRFKAFNDTYGHQAGDDALAAVARSIGDNIRRPADTAARYGGEEFVVILPDTPATGATEIAERIRAAIDARDRTCGKRIRTRHREHRRGKLGPGQEGEVESVIKAADEALYHAKETGRNKVASHETGT